MAKTNSERQAEYRARRNQGEGERRINTWVSVSADLALKRLANRYGVTKRTMIERLVIAEDERIIKTLELDSQEWDDYFNV
jgi:hypothetical protein